MAALSLLKDVEITTSNAILEAIKARAIAKWGEDKWIANLVREYVKITKSRGDEKATIVNRRPQLERAFEAGSCNLDTAVNLAAAVGCKFQMVCTNLSVAEKRDDLERSSKHPALFSSQESATPII